MKQLSLLTTCCLLLTFFSCKTQEQTTATIKRKEKLDKVYTTESGLQYMFTAFGTGVQAKKGDRVSVHYIGKLSDGKEFDNTYKKGQPASFILGDGKGIKGWDEGIALLYVGDKATLTIPPGLGYGTFEIPRLIPANSTLVFEVELLSIQ